MVRKVSLFMIAKENSSRLPGKNNLLYKGLPMYIYTLKKMSNFDVEIYFNSDSIAMLEKAKENFPFLHTMLRDENLRDNNLPSVPLFQSMVEYFNLQSSSILNVQANSPSISISLIADAIKIMTHCNVSELLTIYPDTRKNNGSLWGFSCERLKNYGDPYIHKPDFLICDPSIDIHTEQEFNESLQQI